MKKEWMLAYPRQAQGNWYHLGNLLEVGEIYQATISYLPTHKVKVLTICGKDDMRRWILDTRQKIETFYWYLKNTFGTGALKLRMEVKQK